MSSLSATAVAILRTINDDYEHFNYIVKEVNSFHNIGSTPDEIRDVLADLIAKHYAQAFNLSEKPPHGQPVPFCGDRIDELWFHVTPSGKKLVEES